MDIWSRYVQFDPNRLPWVTFAQTIALCCSNCPAIPVLRVIDGDTFTTTGNQSVRLFGVDTPERGEKCYIEATARLRELAGDDVRVEIGP